MRIEVEPSVPHNHGPGEYGWRKCSTCIRACARGDAGPGKQAEALAILEEREGS